MQPAVDQDNPIATSVFRTHRMKNKCMLVFVNMHFAAHEHTTCFSRRCLREFLRRACFRKERNATEIESSENCGIVFIAHAVQAVVLHSMGRPAMQMVPIPSELETVRSKPGSQHAHHVLVRLHLPAAADSLRPSSTHSGPYAVAANVELPSPERFD